MDGDYKTRAFASATIAGVFAVHGIRVIESEKGRFIAILQESYGASPKHFCRHN